MPEEDDDPETLYTIEPDRPSRRRGRSSGRRATEALDPFGPGPTAPHPYAPAGPKLRVLREMSKWTVEEIADRTGVPHDVLAAFEKGDSAAAKRLTLSDLERLAQACCGSLDDLLDPEQIAEARRAERRKHRRTPVYGSSDWIWG
jgi:transcriptional regulator with XRE-family HTH domain